ncbi:unnamed protein product, partial [Adineta steineri]
MPVLLPPRHHNEKLEQIITSHKNNTKLDLRSKNLTNKDAEIIAYYALENNKTLSTLDLGHNKIGGQGMKHLSDALLLNT